MVCPLIPDASGESSHAQVRATSSGVMRRRKAVALRQSSNRASASTCSRRATFSTSVRSIGLSTLPGQTALARPPAAAISAARLWTKPIRANLEAT